MNFLRSIPRGGRLNRFVTAIASNGLSQVLGAAHALLLLPLFLRAWGSEAYGQWLAISAAVYYLALLDFGGQTYICNLLTIAHARGERETFRDRLNEGVSLFLTVCAFAWVLVGGAILVLRPELGGERTSHLGYDGAWIVLALATTLLITVPTGMYATVYRATGRFTRGAMLANIFRGLELSLFATLLYLRCTPLQYAFATLGATIVRAVVISLDIKRSIPEAAELRLSLVLAWRGRKHAHGSLLFWLYSLAVGMNQQGLLLVLAAVVGPLGVAVFATHRTVAGLVSYVPTLVQGPLLPELGRLWAIGRQQDLARVALVTVRLVMLLSGIAAFALYVAMPIVYPLWTGRQLALDPLLLSLVLLQAALAAGWSTSVWAPMAGNRHQAIAMWSIANAVLTLLAAYFLGKRFGLVGVALATLAADIACGLAVYPVLAARFLQIPRATVARALMVPAMVLALPILMVAVANRFLGATFALIALSIAIALWVFAAYRVAHRTLMSLRLRPAS